MLTRMTDEDWDRVVQVFRAVRSRRGGKGRNDRRFLEAVHYFCVHNITSAFTTSLGAPCRPSAGTGIPCGSAFGA